MGKRKDGVSFKGVQILCRFHTRIRPVVVCPEISSPAQSLASVINVPSNSCLPRCAFCSFCLGSLGAYSASLRQHKKAKARHIRTMRRPARKVHMLDSRKHQYFRTARHPSGSVGSSVVASVGDTQAAPSLVMLADLGGYSQARAARGPNKPRAAFTTLGTAVLMHQTQPTLPTTLTVHHLQLVTYQKIFKLKKTILYFSLSLCSSVYCRVQCARTHTPHRALTMSVYPWDATSARTLDAPLS